MNYGDWYTDRCDVCRVRAQTEEALTRNERVQVYADIPCRMYEADMRAIRMDQTAADIRREPKLMLSNRYRIEAGDLLIIRRGAREEDQPLRAFAGEPVRYYEPFGAVAPGLAHQEIRLLEQERIGGGLEDGPQGAYQGDAGD